MALFSRRIGIDLGTANVLVTVPGQGVILNEPSVVALGEDGKILAIGRAAREMIGRTPEAITARRPLRNGVIADYRLTEAMIRYLIGQASGRIRLLRPEVMVSVPAGVTSTERRAVVEATTRAGARVAYLITEPLAAALGADIPVGTPTGNLIVDIGGGTTEVALISLGGIVAHSSIRVGGDKFDEAITAYLRKKHSLLIGEQTAEEVKMKIGSALPVSKDQEIEVKGRDLIGGLPKTATVTTNEIAGALRDELLQVAGAVKSVLEQTPPELASDVIDRGVVLSGGGSMLRGIDTYIAEATGVPAHLATDPLLCVARGCGMALDNLDTYKRNLVTSS